MHLDQTRFHKVIDDIYDHLDGHLDLDKLAEIVSISPYHWHRLYRDIMEETYGMPPGDFSPTR
jgi:AraC family transcriptional regulator